MHLSYIKMASHAVGDTIFFSLWWLLEGNNLFHGTSPPFLYRIQHPEFLASWTEGPAGRLWMVKYLECDMEVPTRRHFFDKKLWPKGSRFDTNFETWRGEKPRSFGMFWVAEYDMVSVSRWIHHIILLSWYNLEFSPPLRMIMWYLLGMDVHGYSSSTSLKINMEPKNHPFEKDNHLPNLRCWVPCWVVPYCIWRCHLCWWFQEQVLATRLSAFRPGDLG